MSSVVANVIKKRWSSARSLYEEYPRQFWILIAATFIDRLGGALLFPFFTLYLTRKFEIGMTQVGVIFGIFSISSVVGSMFGGALTDRFGRKGMLIFGLVMSAVSTILMGVISDLQLFFIVTLVVGVLAETGWPAQQAMVADLLPDEKRAEGFGILRVVANLSVTIGPVIGGLLAARSYLLLFIIDAITSLITAAIVFLVLKETKRPLEEGEPEQTMKETFGGYLLAVRDGAFLWFILASMLSVLVYMQMNTTLSVYLRDYHGIPEQGFGYLLSLNAAMVVLFQFSVTRWVNKFRPLIIMTAGTLLYAIGFGMYGLVNAYILFMLAMVIITIGEMMVSPVGQAIVARMAPEDMRGRYMAVYGFSWVLPSAVGPLMAGVVIDNLNPDWVWYGAGVLGVLAALAYYFLEVRVGRSKWQAVDARVAIIQRLEEGEISAEEASRLMEAVQEGSWAKLSTPDERVADRRHLRIRVSSLTSGVMKSDLRIPMGLVSAALNSGGRLSNDLDRYDPLHLQALITRSSTQNGVSNLDDGDERLEISVE